MPRTNQIPPAEPVVLGRPLEGSVTLDLRGEQALIVSSWLVALDIRQPELYQDAADVLVLELDGAIGGPARRGIRALRCSDFLYGSPCNSASSMAK